MLPLVQSETWQLKPYRILGRTYDGAPTLDQAAIDLIASDLPDPASLSHCPGLGFVIEHLATPVDYLVLCWWQNKNEIITRIYIRGAGAAWRPTDGNESFCVWDLDIMWFERNAFIRTMLSFPVHDPAAYLAARFEKASVG